MVGISGRLPCFPYVLHSQPRFKLKMVRQSWETSSTVQLLRKMLSERTIGGSSSHGAWKQYFKRSGYTSYKELASMRVSEGRWAIKDDQYCSPWPPSRTWDCYHVYSFGATGVTFVASDSGEHWPGTKRSFA